MAPQCTISCKKERSSLGRMVEKPFSEREEVDFLKHLFVRYYNSGPGRRQNHPTERNQDPGTGIEKKLSPTHTMISKCLLLQETIAVSSRLSYRGGKFDELPHRPVVDMQSYWQQ